MSTDYRGMFDREYLGAWDIAGRDYTLEIARVTAGELTGEGGRKTRKPVVYFKDAKKGLALNKTNARIIAGLYGNDTSAWIGRRVTLFATTTTFGSDTVECIRVRAEAPAPRAERNGPRPVDPDLRRQQQDADELAARLESMGADDDAAA